MAAMFPADRIYLFYLFFFFFFLVLVQLAIEGNMLTTIYIRGVVLEEMR